MNTRTLSLLLLATLARPAAAVPAVIVGTPTTEPVFRPHPRAELFWSGRRLRGAAGFRVYDFPDGEVVLERHPDPAHPPTLVWTASGGARVPFGTLGPRAADGFLFVRWRVHPHPGVTLAAGEAGFQVHLALPPAPAPVADPRAALGELHEGGIPAWFDSVGFADSRPRLASLPDEGLALEVSVRGSGCLNGPFPGGSCHAIGAASATFRFAGAEVTRGRVTLPFPDGVRRPVAAVLPVPGEEPRVELLKIVDLDTDGQAVALRLPGPSTES